MAGLSYAQLMGLWLQTAKGTQYGTRAWAALMAAIAEAESGGNPDATNPTDNDGAQTSYGLWQISNGTHKPPAANWADPATNAQLALGKLQDPTQGLAAWGTYDSGAYKAYLSGSTTPDMSIPGNAGALTAETTSANVSDCLYGFSGLPGTSWLNDITGSGGNVGQICILTRSQARGLIGGVLVGIGMPVMALGLGLAFYEIGMHTRLGQIAVSLATRGGVQPQAPAPKPAKQSTRVGQDLSTDEVATARANRAALDKQKAAAARRRERDTAAGEAKAGRAGPGDALPG